MTVGDFRDPLPWQLVVYACVQLVVVVGGLLAMGFLIGRCWS